MLITHDEKVKAAECPHTHSLILASLAEDDDFTIRRRIAANTGVPGRYLKKLSKDPDATTHTRHGLWYAYWWITELADCTQRRIDLCEGHGIKYNRGN